jgi:hypothetical protein
MSVTYRYHHVGIPTRSHVEGMERLDHLGLSCTDHASNPFGIQWMRYHPDCQLPALVRDVAHVAFEVDDLAAALAGKTIIIPPNSPSPGVIVAFIEEAGAPVELIQFTGTASTPA